MNTCRGCGDSALSRVLDLGEVPAADHFPLATDLVRPEETSHSLAMDVCSACGLAQLAEDDTITDEPRGIEPQALKDQAEAAVKEVDAAGWLRGRTVLEFGSPHGGTWIPLLARRGFTVTGSQADVVLDCFGIMHEPDQAARSRGAHRSLAPVGAVAAVPLDCHDRRQGQWNALRHGHFAYYSLTTLASADYFVLLDGDDLLAAGALARGTGP
jgi:Putative zinc binding domain